MKIQVIGDKKAVLVKVFGELDHHKAARLSAAADGALCSSNAVNVIFDFSELEFMDSAGIGVIMGRYKKTRTLGGRVVVFGANASVLRIMQMSGMDKIVKLVPSLEKALRRLDNQKGAVTWTM